jgi:hypothetical protein
MYYNKYNNKNYYYYITRGGPCTGRYSSPAYNYVRRPVCIVSVAYV